MSKLIRALVVIAGWSCLALALPSASQIETSSTVGLQSVASEARAVVGVTSRPALASPELNNTICFASTAKSKMLDEGTPVLIAEKVRCQPRFGSLKTFFRILVAGKSLYVDEDRVRLKDSDLLYLDSLSDEQKQAVADHAQQMSILIRKQALDELLAAIEATRSHGLTIIKSSIADASEHTEGTSFKVTVANPTSKTIKYVTFSVLGINAVGDPVRDRLKGGPVLTVRGVGPINKDESATYEWEYMWHTDIVERHRITEVKVQYMDNSVRVIKNLKAVTLTEDQRRTWTDE